MHLFYQPDFEQSLALTDDEAFHAAKVLRLREGEQVRVTNGKGYWYNAIIKKNNPKRCELQLIHAEAVLPRSYRIEIAIAPTKNIDRVEWFVEKAVEIGIDSISFFYSEHSERRTIKLDRLQKIAVSAMKQSLQAYLPTINEVGDLRKWLHSLTPQHHERFIAHLPNGQQPAHLFKAATAQRSHLVLIGPEGDFSDNELKLAQELGFMNVVLGPTRLRTETAALTACQILNTLNEVR